MVGSSHGFKLILIIMNFAAADFTVIASDSQSVHFINHRYWHSISSNIQRFNNQQNDFQLEIVSQSQNFISSSLSVSVFKVNELFHWTKSIILFAKFRQQPDYRTHLKTVIICIIELFYSSFLLRTF